MQANPDALVALWLHRSDGYQTPWGDWRKSVFYHYGYIPYTVIDGFIVSSTGLFQTHIDTRLAVPTDITIDIGATPVDTSTYVVTINVCVEAQGATTTMNAHLLDVLDYIPTSASWYRNCVRQGFQLGSITVAPGTCLGVQQQLTFDAVSLGSPENIGLAAFVEQPLAIGPGEVYQSQWAKWPLPATGHPVYSNGMEDGTLGGWSGSTD